MNSENGSVYVGSIEGHHSRVFAYDLGGDRVEDLLEEYEEEQEEDVLALAVENVAADGEELGHSSGYAWGYRGDGPENLIDDINSRESDMDQEWLSHVITSFESDENWIIWPSMSPEGLGPEYRSNSGIESTPP